MTIKKIGTGKASGGATTTKTSGVSGTTTLNTAAINTGMQALQTATPQDTISAIQRLSTTGTGIQPLTTLNAAIVDPGTQTPQTSIDAIQRVQAAAAVSAARAGATTTEQDATAQGILETGAFDSLSERVGDATIEILTGFGTDEFGIENYNDPEWQTAQVDSDGNLNIGVLSEELIASGLGVSQVLCRLVQESDIGTYDLVGFDSYFIMDLETELATTEPSTSRSGRTGGDAPATAPATRATSATTKPDDSATAGTTGMLAGAFFGSSTRPSSLTLGDFSARIYTHGKWRIYEGSSSFTAENFLVFKLYLPILVGDYTEMSIYMIAKNSGHGNTEDITHDTRVLEDLVLNEMAASSPTHFHGYADFGIRVGSTYNFNEVLSGDCSATTDLSVAIGGLLDGTSTVRGGSMGTGGSNEEVDVASLLSGYLSVSHVSEDIADTTGCPGAYTTLQITKMPLGTSLSPKLEIYVMDAYYSIQLADDSGTYTVQDSSALNPVVAWYTSPNYYYLDKNTYTFS